MAVRIRLKKMGRTHRPFFRVCAMDGRAPRDGRVIEELGTYDPMVRETDARALLNGERIDYWLSVGAKPTPKVAVLIKKYGKDGSHLNEQQASLNRLAARRGDAIANATAAAVKAAEEAKAAPPVSEEKPADESAEAAPADEAEASDESEAAAESTSDEGASSEAADTDGEEKTEGEG